MTVGALAHERVGSGPPLVLLHGIGHTRRAWDPVVDRVAAERELVLVDLPGHGESPLPTPDAPGARLGVEELTDHVERFLGDLGLERPAVAGNSLGGALALELARRGVAGPVTALAPIGFWSRSALRYTIMSFHGARALVPVLRPVLPRLLRATPVRAALLAQYFAHPSRLSPAEAERTVDDFATAPGLTAILPYSRHYRFERGEELTGPVTVAWGDRDRLLVGRQFARAKERLPQARHVTLRGCGHVPMPDDPAAVAAVLLAT
ncbi:MAG TPA: alpha/beta fold hydrolase [Acidimicrobiales bacterium]